MVKCTFCGSEVDLGPDALIRGYLPDVQPDRQNDRGPGPQADIGAAPAHAHQAQHPPPAAQPSPFQARLKLISGPLLGIAAGFLGVQALYVFLRNGGEPNVILTAVLMAPVVILLAVTGRRIQSAVVATYCGVLLVAKPFIRPVVMRDGYVFGTTSETHLNYLVPGVLFLVTAGIVALTITRAEKPAKPPYIRGLLAAFGVAVGVAAALPNFGGETIQEAIERNSPRFENVRTALQIISTKLPPPGQVDDKLRRDLRPQPVAGRRYPQRVNTEIIPAEVLVDVYAKPSFDLIVSGDLYMSLLWTGSKNPLSESVLYDRAGDFVKTLDRALSYQYVVVYRGNGARGGGVGSTGAASMDVFVFDLKTTDLVASFHTDKAGSYAEGRESLARGLERATGGLFEFD